jgi:hypothetical protein
MQKCILNDLGDLRTAQVTLTEAAIQLGVEQSDGVVLLSRGFDDSTQQTVGPAKCDELDRLR